MQKLSHICVLLFILVGLLPAEEPPQFQHKRYYQDFQLHSEFQYQVQNVFYDDVKDIINTLTPNVGGEILHEFTLPAAFMEGKSDEEIDRHLYESLTAFSTQKGIEYFSHRRQAYRIFIEESYIVAGKSDRTSQADTMFADNVLPDNNTLFVYQKDSSFGNGVLRVDLAYNAQSHQFYVKTLNEDTIKYKGILPIAKPHEFLLFLLVNREGAKVSIYGVIATRTKTFNALKKRISISMVYRMFALAKWFERESIRPLK